MKHKFQEYMPTSAYIAALVAFDLQVEEFERARDNALNLDLTSTAMYFEKQIREIKKAKDGLQKMFLEL